jgi:hypothetical protein
MEYNPQDQEKRLWSIAEQRRLRLYAAKLMRDLCTQHSVCYKSVMQGSRYKEHLRIRKKAIKEIYQMLPNISMRILGYAFGLDQSTVRHHLTMSEKRKEQKRIHSLTYLRRKTDDTARHQDTHC